MARPLAPIAQVWDRHTIGCKRQTVYMVGNHAIRENGYVCTKCRGSQHTLEVRYHALITLVGLTGQGIRVDGRDIRVSEYRADMGPAMVEDVMTPGRWVYVADCEADRVISGGDYVPGNIVLVPADVNEYRHAAQFNWDSWHAATIRASERVIGRQGIRRGPNAFTRHDKALVRGKSNGRAMRPMAETIAAIESGRYAR